MNVIVTILLILLGIVVLLADLVGLLFLNSRVQFRLAAKRSQAALGPEAPTIEVDGLRFRDLNKNGKLDVVFGRYNPSGKLPFEMPRSMEAVRAQKEDLPYDSEDPLFPFGHGLSYEE